MDALVFCCLCVNFVFRDMDFREMELDEEQKKWIDEELKKRYRLNNKIMFKHLGNELLEYHDFFS